MKGLLLKESYMINKYCRMYLVLVCVFAVIFVMSGNEFMMFYPVVLTGILPMSLVSYDERSKWCVYADAFPYTRKQIVSAKYLITLFYLLAAVVILAAAGAVKSSLFPDGGMDMKGYLFSISMIPVAGLFIPSIMLPPVFKLGVEKGRIVYYAEIFAVALIFGIFTEFQTELAQWLAHFGRLIVPIALAGMMLLFGMSWILSVKFYESREL